MTVKQAAIVSGAIGLAWLAGNPLPLLIMLLGFIEPIQAYFINKAVGTGESSDSSNGDRKGRGRPARIRAGGRR
eukprot:tig00021726_g23257.t1